MLEHAAHLFRKLLEVLIGLSLSLFKFFLIISQVLFEVLDLLKTSTYGVLLRLVSIEGGSVNAEHARDVLELIFIEGAALLFALLLRFKVVWDAFFANKTNN